MDGVIRTIASDYKQLIVRAVRMLNSHGLMDMNGHVSLRDADAPERMWINSRQASRSTLRASDIISIDLDSGKRIGECPEPPSEFHIHRAIMRRRKDVDTVIHAHPEHIVILSIAGHALRPVVGAGSFLPEPVPLFDDANLINTEERGEAVADILGHAPAIVLRGHGVVVVGANLEEAIVRYAGAESNARIQYKASVLGEPHILQGDELVAMRSSLWTPKIMAKHWHYHEETARRRKAFEDID
jgi:ribulose-5-phosphate 4-epimerase/fuculose-1-phosphate aldolase